MTMVDVDDSNLQVNSVPKLVGWLGLRVGSHMVLSILYI